MKIEVDISAEDSPVMDVAFVEGVVKEALVRGIHGEVDDTVSFGLEVVFVSEERIRSLNTSYRSKDAATDVLSFGEYADTGLPDVSQAHGQILLGQLFLCYDYIARAAHEDGVSLEREMAYILSHGVLHLLGYDHTDEMFLIQENISESFL